MKKNEKIFVERDGKYYECTVLTFKKEKKKPNVQGTIYNILNTAEIVAVKLAQLNEVRKRYEKMKKKKLKKFGKVDKKTGTLILRGVKRQKPAKTVKRYTVDELKRLK